MSKLLTDIVNFLSQLLLAPLNQIQAQLKKLLHEVEEIEKKVNEKDTKLDEILQKLADQQVLLEKIAAEVVPQQPGTVANQSIIFALPK